MNDHAPLRELAGGYVLGALSATDRERFEAHLAGCGSCREEVASLAALPGLLTRAGTDPAPALPSRVVDAAVDRAGDEWEALRRSRAAWRWVAGVAAGLLLFTLVLPRLPTEDASVTLVVATADASGEVAIEARPWGTAVSLTLDDLPARDRYVAWVVARDGTRQQAATWGPTPTGRAIVRGASSIPTERVVEVAVTDGSGTETLLTAGY